MVTTTFPASIYDQPANLLAALGSFWSQQYTRRDQVVSLLAGKAIVEKQTEQDFAELVAALSRFTVPIFHQDNWYCLRIRESELNTTSTTTVQYGSGRTYGDGLVYGTHRNIFAYPKPAKLHSVANIVNNLLGPSLIWTAGTDFELTADAIVFHQDPFTDGRVAVRQIFDEDGHEQDREATLWLFRGQFDWATIYEQFGYAVGLRLTSSRGYRDLLNAVYDAIISGTTRSNILTALSVITGVPLTREAEEQVEDISRGEQELLVVTNYHAYRFHPTATPLVEVGQTVKRWEPLTDALRVDTFTQGEHHDVPRLAMGQGFLTTCFYGDLIFENRDVLLTVDEDHPSGFTRVSWPLGGFPLDVDHFFTEMHNRGIAAAREATECDDPEKTILYPSADGDISRIPGTFAHLLDTRTTKVGEPTAQNLPATINPLQFLTSNVLRNNAYLVRVKTNGFDTGGLGMHQLNILRKIVPPHTAMLLMIDLTLASDSVGVSNVSNSLSTFTGMEPLTDTVVAAMVDVSKLTLRVVGGHCH